MVEKVNLISFIEKNNSNLNRSTKEFELEENNVSELHIHKILFIVYGAFYTKFNRELFEPNFQAWKYGPVEINYRNYVKNNDQSSLKKFNIVLNDNKEKVYLSNLIIKLLKFSPWSLVDYTHSLDAWINNYDNEENKLNSISKEDIFKSFKNKKFD